MPYTANTLPDYIKKKPKKLQDQWLTVFNASFDKGETYAFKAANAAIKENDVMSKTLLTELQNDIDMILQKAGDGLKGKEGSPAIRQFLREVKIKVKNMIAKIEDKETKALAESICAKLEEVVPEEKSNIKEADIKDLKESQTLDFQVSDYISLSEAKFNADFSEVEVVLIEQGCNEQKKRYYPDKTIREAAPIFKGFKMYINHPTAQEEQTRPERNLRDWASTIVESRYEDGKAIGRVAVHDNWLRERLADPVARNHIGLSINTGGKVSVGKVNGKEGYQIVEAIIPARKNGPPSVDWVTEPGARGRVSKLLESRNIGGTKMELENATLKDLQETRKDLVESIRKETEAGSAGKVAELEKQLQESNAKLAEHDKTSKMAKQVELAESILKDKKIPEVSKNKILGQVKSAAIEGDIKEAVTKLVEAELEYVNKLSETGKIKHQSGEGSGELKESLQEALDKRAHVETKKEEK